MKKLRIIGIDLGLNSCGVSISDNSNIISIGLLNIKHGDNFVYLVDELDKKIFRKYKLDTIIIGYPQGNNSQLNTMTKYIIKFKEFLEKYIIKNNYKYFIKFVNEFNTTNEFLDQLKIMNIKYKKVKKIKDIQSARNILTTYLNKINK